MHVCKIDIIYSTIILIFLIAACAWLHVAKNMETGYMDILGVTHINIQS